VYSEECGGIDFGDGMEKLERFKGWGLSEIEIKSRRNIAERVANAIDVGVSVIYNDCYVVMQVGETTYISLDFLKTLTIEQIEDILQHIW
jgi:hypothetical protein